MNKLFNALKGINIFGLALVLIASAIMITQSAFTPSKRAGAYRYDPLLTQQDWNSTSLDQNSAHYSLIGSTPVDCQDTDKICTYDYDADNEAFVQNSKGTFQ